MPTKKLIMAQLKLPLLSKLAEVIFSAVTIKLNAFKLEICVEIVIVIHKVIDIKSRLFFQIGVLKFATLKQR